MKLNYPTFDILYEDQLSGKGCNAEVGGRKAKRTTKSKEVGLGYSGKECMKEWIRDRSSQRKSMWLLGVRNDLMAYHQSMEIHIESVTFCCRLISHLIQVPW